ncbi:MAG: hypothetical protein ACK4NZ_12130 [Tsuneonella sp.]
MTVLETYSQSIRREVGAAAMKGTATRAELYETVDVLVAAIGELRQQIKAVEGRQDSFEKSGVRFRGVYQRASTYRLGDQATHKGSLWTALGDVPEGSVPGEHPALWQLSAKGAG